MAGMQESDWEWFRDRFTAGRDWLAEHFGPPRSWLRREPLPKRPLIFVATAAASGVAASRSLAGVAGWWAVAWLALAVWLWLVRRRRAQVAGIALLVAVAAAMASW